MTGLLVFLTLIFAVIVAIDASILAGILLFIGMLAATGAGQFLKRVRSGIKHSPSVLILISLVSLFVLALSAWLGSFSAIRIYDVWIPGMLWAPVAGFVAGFLLSAEQIDQES